MTKNTKVLRDDQLAPGVTVEMIRLTPMVAQHFLDKLPKRQRNLSPKQVERYARDIQTDNWPFIGGVIAFNCDDEMIDGQHRCRSVVETGRSIVTLVVHGLNSEAITPMDTGRNRTFADMLAIAEVTNISTVSALTKKVWHWQRGNYADGAVPRQFNAPFLHASGTNAELWATYREMEKEIKDAAMHGNGLAGAFRGSMPPSGFAFSWLLLGRIDVDAREAFFHELRKGPAKLGAEYPITALRRKLSQRRTAGDPKIPGWVWQHYLFYAWNAYVDGAPVGLLKRPSIPKHNFVALPRDPLAELRDPGWEPLPLIPDLSAAASLPREGVEDDEETE